MLWPYTGAGFGDLEITPFVAYNFLGPETFDDIERFRQAADPSSSVPPGKVWNEEHGHWHDAAGVPGSGPPLGPAPPGKEWSYEHGHWHDAAVPGLGRPPGPAPPGKVWDEGHGHWHDVEGAEPAGELPPTGLAEDDVSYSEEEP